jgi:MoxR-like ATPase
MNLARRTRVGHDSQAPAFIQELVRWGIGPRACQHMILGAKARALLHARSHVAVEDINAVAPAVMRHRLVLTFTAASEGMTPDMIVAQLIESTPARQNVLSGDETVQQTLRPRDCQ